MPQASTTADGLQRGFKGGMRSDLKLFDVFRI